MLVQDNFDNMADLYGKQVLKDGLAAHGLNGPKLRAKQADDGWGMGSNPFATKADLAWALNEDEHFALRDLYPNGYPLFIYRCRVAQMDLRKKKLIKHYHPKWNEYIGERYVGRLTLDPNSREHSAVWIPARAFTKASPFTMSGQRRQVTPRPPPEPVDLSVPTGVTLVKRRGHFLVLQTNYWRLWFAILEDR